MANKSKILETLSTDYPVTILLHLTPKSIKSKVVTLLEEWVNSEGAGDNIAGYIANDPISLFAGRGGCDF